MTMGLGRNIHTGFIIVVFFHTIAAITYDLSKLCFRDPFSETSTAIPVRSGSRRQFAPLLDTASRDETVLFTFRDPNGSLSLNCFFGVKATKTFSNMTVLIQWWGMNNTCSSVKVIRAFEHSSFRLEETGHYLMTVPGFLPLYFQATICEGSDYPKELIITISSPSEGSQALPSFILTVLAPCGIIVLVMATALLLCCCCHALLGRTKLAPGVVSNRPLPSVSGLVDKPPSYDALFPHRSAPEEPPPPYDHLRM